MTAFILLQSGSGGGNPMLSMLFPLLILVVFYFFLIRPQVKRQKDQQKFIDGLKEGMEVVTMSGIVGKITKIDGNVVRLMTDEKTFLRVLKSSITNEMKA